MVHKYDSCGSDSRGPRPSGRVARLTVARPCRIPTGFRVAVVNIGQTVPRKGRTAKTGPFAVILLMVAARRPGVRYAVPSQGADALRNRMYGRSPGSAAGKTVARTP
ncbi:hypothetical protein GCM10009646_27570 [Streptomyces aureus]